MTDGLALPPRTIGPRELALFAGIGGGLLGTRLLGFIPVCAVEKKPYRREVLLRRQRDGVFPLFAIWDDIRTFDGRPWCGKVDIVTAGFPCQPFSIAGKQRGEADERNMWPETIRVIREVGPRYCFLENVPQLVRHDYFGKILGDLAEAGFDAEWDIVSAADVGAPHLRKRLWIVGWNANSMRCDWDGRSKRKIQDKTPNANRVCKDVPDAIRTECESGTGGRGVWEGDTEVADTESDRLQRDGATRQQESITRRTEEESQGLCGYDWWSTERGLDRVASGTPNRIHRLAGIGDSQVPAVVAFAWRLLSGEISDD